MTVYRIVNTEARATDLSGLGAYKFGGRWNNAGVYAVYTSEHEALCMLEMLVHISREELPDTLFIMEISVLDDAPVLILKEKQLPENWRLAENLALKNKGSAIFNENRYVAICAPSAVLPNGNNYILNPMHPEFKKWVKLVKYYAYKMDARLKY